MLTAVARDQRWPDVVAGISARFSKFALFCFHLMTGPLGNSEFVAGNIEILGKQNSLFPSGPVIKCEMLNAYLDSQQQVSLQCPYSSFPTAFQYGIQMECHFRKSWVKKTPP